MDRKYIPFKEYPDETWLTRVRQENVVYLVKENRFAIVQWEYEPAHANQFCGRIGLQFLNTECDRIEYKDTWFVRQNGQGINGTQCLMPVMGHLPDDEPDLTPQELRHVLRRLERLEEIVLYGGRPKKTVIVDMPFSSDIVRKGSN